MTTTKDALRPNAHPYAIVSTSTALLSRSNSSASPHSFSIHHYIPPSPSHTNPPSPTKHPRTTRHRYSRSLTSDLPRPLPPPPPTSASASPTPNFGLEQDDTPRRRSRRAETLPSSTSAPLPDVPEDPKQWTASHLSTYLASSLRVTSGDIPVPVARDIAAFVREKNITGRLFLRLNEDDWEKYGINSRWRIALVSSARSLRQNVIRGRIWGFSDPKNDDPFQLADEPRSSLSTSSLDDHKRGRDRFSISNSNGRVRGMIDSIERTSSNDERSRSNSPTKMDRSGSPTKQSRPLSQIFSTVKYQRRRTGSITSQSSSDFGYEATLKEPRLLPLPPSHSPLYSPQPTGVGPMLTGGSDEFSPQPTGTSIAYFTPIPTGDPSYYQPSGLVAGGYHDTTPLHSNGTGTSRLLPIPPQPPQIFQPKPVSPFKPNTVDILSDATSNDGYESASGYDTALESADEPRVSHESEPSIEELLASHPSQGAEAWELELGETVKRIGGGAEVIGRSGKRTGRKAGRKAFGGFEAVGGLFGGDVKKEDEEKPDHEEQEIKKQVQEKKQVQKEDEIQARIEQATLEHTSRVETLSHSLASTEEQHLLECTAHTETKRLLALAQSRVEALESALAQSHRENKDKIQSLEADLAQTREVASGLGERVGEVERKMEELEGVVDARERKRNQVEPRRTLDVRVWIHRVLGAVLGAGSSNGKERPEMNVRQQGAYGVMIGIGVCAIVLRALVRRVGGRR